MLLLIGSWKNELHLAEAMSLEQKQKITLWIEVMPSQKKKQHRKFNELNKQEDLQTR